MELITTNPSTTMSSREIAELTGKRHDNVTQLIRKLIADQILTPEIQELDYEHRGNIYTQFQLIKRDSLVVVARLSPEFTAAVIDRWQELEAKTPALPDFSDPVTAARAWADAKESEQKALLQIEQDKPKVDFYNDVTGSDDTITIGEVAKVLNIKGMGRNKMFAFLRDQGVLRANNEPYQTYIDRGYFRLIESKFQKPNGDTCINIKTVVYQKGVDFIRKKIKSTIGK